MAPLPSAQLLELQAGYLAMSKEMARNQAHQAQMMGALQDIANRMDAFGTQIIKLAAAVSDLEHTRKSLMARYDGEMTAMRMRLEQMQTAARDNPGLEVAAARLGQAAYRIESALQALPAAPVQAPPQENPPPRTPPASTRPPPYVDGDEFE